MVRTFAVHAYVKSPTKQVIPLCTGSLSLSLSLSPLVCVSFLTVSKPHFPTPNLPVPKIIEDITVAEGEDFLSGVISNNQ